MRINRTALLHGAALGLTVAGAAHAHHRQPVDFRLLANAANEPSADALDRGRALFASHDVPGALAAFRQAAVAAPRSLDALLGVALCYEALGRSDVARAFYEAALAIDPASPEVTSAYHHSLALVGETAANARAAQVPERAHAWVPEAPLARIERTSEGEQRLIIGAPPPARELAALGEAAGIVEVAPRWTPHDDVILASNERAAVRAETALDAQRRAETVDGEAIPAVVSPPAVPPVPLLAAAVFPSAGLQWQSPQSPGLAQSIPLAMRRRVWTPARQGFAASTVPAPSDGLAEADRAFARSIAANAGTLRRVAARPVLAAALAGERPSIKRQLAVFDSDDGALNAFAAKLHARGLTSLSGVALAPRSAATARSALARLDRFAARVAGV